MGQCVYQNCAFMSVLTTRLYGDTNGLRGPWVWIVWRFAEVSGRWWDGWKAWSWGCEWRGTEDGLTVDVGWDEDDLFVSDVVVGDVIDDYSSGRLTINVRCPSASVPDVTVHRDDVKLVHRRMCWTHVCLTSRLLGYNDKQQKAQLSQRVCAMFRVTEYFKMSLLKGFVQRLIGYTCRVSSTSDQRSRSLIYHRALWKRIPTPTSSVADLLNYIAFRKNARFCFLA